MNVVKMKRIGIIIIFLLVGKLLLAQTPMYEIEVYLDGHPILDFNTLDVKDMQWKMTNLSVTPPVSVTQDEVIAWSLDPWGMDGNSLPAYILNLQELYNKRPIIGGETLLFDLEVVSGPYAGYSGSLTFMTNGDDTTLLGSSGINLTKE